MSNLIFIFKAYNPNKRSTYFKHKNYTDYIANSEYVIRNKETTHGLFGIVDKFPNIQKEENLSEIVNYIDDLAKAKVPIYRGLVSLTEFDAERLGYYDQDKWKKLLENRLPSIAEKMNIKFSDLQYLGAVHYEDRHPHLQFFVWSKSSRNYFIKYKEINKMRNEFINDVFKEDLLPIYQDKDLAKKNITGENYILQELKKANLDEKFVKDLMKYQKNAFQNHRVRSILKDEDIKEIVDAMLLLKDELKRTTGSIKYQYLKAYPEIIANVNTIANRIIELFHNVKKKLINILKQNKSWLNLNILIKKKLKMKNKRLGRKPKKKL